MILGIKLMLENTNNNNRQLILEDIPLCFSYNIHDFYCNDKNSKLWVLVNEGIVYGYIAVDIDEYEGILNGIYLDRLLRGSGLATEMLNKVKDFCKERNCKKIILEVPSYLPNGVKFYVNNGFEYSKSKMEYENTVKMLYYKYNI